MQVMNLTFLLACGKVAFGYGPLAHLDLGDRMSHLLDSRFADDILIFGESVQAIGSTLDAVVSCLEQVGLKLNASRTSRRTF